MSTSGELPPISDNCCFCTEPHRGPPAQLRAATICGTAVDTHRVAGCIISEMQAQVCAPHTSPSARLHAVNPLPAQPAGNPRQPPNVPQPDKAAVTLASSTTLIRNLACMTAVVALGACGVAFMLRGFPHNWGEARKELKELIQHDVDLRVRPVEGGSELLLHGMGGKRCSTAGAMANGSDCVAEPWK